MDGVHYAVRFKGTIKKRFFLILVYFSSISCISIDYFDTFILTVILDLKALYLLLVQRGEEDFKLGKRGIEVEFCFICKALRVCRSIQYH